MVYRDVFKQCFCGGTFANVRWASHLYERCRGCSGIWINEDVLSSMWVGMGGPRPAPPLVARPRKDGHEPRPCLECRRVMERIELLVVPVDRCPTHGYWFDNEELSTLLAGAALEPADWLRHFAETLRDMT